MAKPAILVAGGAGYIGSHFCRAAQDAGFAPVVVDRLSSASPRVETFRRSTAKGLTLEVADIGDTQAIEAIIAEHKPVAAVCFAALIEVAESIAQPEVYWENNFTKAARFFGALEKNGVKKLVFSSTAAVYGVHDKPLKESDPLSPINPYGITKLGCEAMLQGHAGNHEEILKRAKGKLERFNLNSVIFRYFNAAGAAYGLGEMHEPETHLIPNAIFAAFGQRGFGESGKKFSLFGTDYPTRDGTPIRDYIHVSDLADAHVTALRYLLDGGKSDAFNLGTGHGASVREVVTTVRKVTGKDFAVNEEPRRAGDPPFLVADAAKAKSILGWQPRYDLQGILESAAVFHREHG